MSVAGSALRKIFFARVRIPWRAVAVATVIALLAAGGLIAAGRNLPPPRFVLDRGQGSVDPVGYPWWRKASDWLAGRKYAVLTFDDGPYGHGVDEQILAILRHHHAHAMFFLICGRVTAATNAVPDEIAKAGDIVASHSYDHPHLTKLSASALHHEIEDCSARIAALTGQRPQYFRPPFGQASARVETAVQLAGMRQVLWNANSEDSWLKRPNQILDWSLEETSNGSILLMHDKPTTAVVLDRVLTELERKGFRFVLPSGA